MAKPTSHRKAIDPDIASEPVQLSDLKTYLEELILLVSQTNDSNTVNLTTKFEQFERKQEEMAQKRWNSFQWAVGIIALLITVALPYAAVRSDKVQGQLEAITNKISVMEAGQHDKVTHEEVTKLLKELEKKDIMIEASLKDCVNHKELSVLRQELVDLMLRKDGGAKK